MKYTVADLQRMRDIIAPLHGLFGNDYLEQTERYLVTYMMNENTWQELNDAYFAKYQEHLYNSEGQRLTR